jgi:hypothetical protein
MMKRALILVAFAALGIATAQADEVRMKGDEILQALSGKHVDAVNPKGKKWSADYKADGTVTYGGGGTGAWRVNGDQFCDFPKGDKEYCAAVVKAGDNQYQLMAPDGSKKGSLLTVE